MHTKKYGPVSPFHVLLEVGRPTYLYSSGLLHIPAITLFPAQWYQGMRVNESNEGKYYHITSTKQSTGKPRTYFTWCTIRGSTVVFDYCLYVAQFVRLYNSYFDFTIHIFEIHNVKEYQMRYVYWLFRLYPQESIPTCTQWLPSKRLLNYTYADICKGHVHVSVHMNVVRGVLIGKNITHLMCI